MQGRGFSRGIGGGAAFAGGAAIAGIAKIVRPFGLFAAAYAVLAVPAVFALQPPLHYVVITVLLGLVLAALSAIDVDSLRLPDALTLPLAAAGLGLSVYLQWDDPWSRVLAVIAGYVVLWAVAYGYERLRG
ncbi:MAG: prepilin peptidase, partial [Hyphomicrobiaceae bacterium]